MTGLYKHRWYQTHPSVAFLALVKGLLGKNCLVYAWCAPFIGNGDISCEPHLVCLTLWLVWVLWLAGPMGPLFFTYEVFGM